MKCPIPYTARPMVMLVVMVAGLVSLVVAAMAYGPPPETSVRNTVQRIEAKLDALARECKL